MGRQNIKRSISNAKASLNVKPPVDGTPKESADDDDKTKDPDPDANTGEGGEGSETTLVEKVKNAVTGGGKKKNKSKKKAK